ncbi:MAG: RNA polymerase factor sigma-54 [bacterium]|nr:RNA polymerase factor sigma-54 [bacterium]
MALEQKLRLKLAQRLVMTPSLQQAIKLLQLSRLELEEALSQEILENPILDVEETQEDAPQPEIDEGKTASEAGSETSEKVEAEPPPPEDPLPTEEESYSDIDIEAFFSDYLADGRTEGPSLVRARETEVPLENVVSRSPGLYEHLNWQLHLASCPPNLVAICEFIIGNLDEDGYLRVSDEEIARATEAPVKDVEVAVRVVRALDPPGIAARTLQECLLAQLEPIIENADEDEQELLSRVCQVVVERWEDFLHQKWDRLAEFLDCELSELKPLLEVVHRLEPKPGRIYHQERNPYIEPDVYVRKVDGEYTITLNDDGLPRLRINARYARMLEGGEEDPQVGSYLREKMRNAVWLMKSIDQRQRTIYRVAESIVSFQRGFLDRGLEQLKPMVLRQVAEDIGMHESTISRVVSNKYMYTPRGLFPMKFFFHSGVDSARGENISSLVVKERIRKLVDAEDPGRPLSDSKIMKMLQREGIRLARRTVAKYREEMTIPSSDKRKRVF